jgi:hypothetical protein
MKKGDGNGYNSSAINNVDDYTKSDAENNLLI